MALYSFSSEISGDVFHKREVAKVKFEFYTEKDLTKR